MGKAHQQPKSAAAIRPRQVLDGLARRVGCTLVTIGDIERLAGVNTNCHAERYVLWVKFRHLWSGPVQPLFDAVMDHCAEIALQRITAGELCLVRA